MSNWAPASPTFLVIHGAWHNPEHYAMLCNAIQRSGGETVCPYLPSCSGEIPPTQTLEDDILLIRQTAQSLLDQGKRVVAVMHSYGGMVGTDALEGLPIDQLIYVAAFVPPSGKSLTDMFDGHSAPFISIDVSVKLPTSRQMKEKELMRCRYEQDEKGVTSVPDPVPVFYQDIPTSHTTVWVEKLTTQAKSAQLKPISREAYRNIPATYIVCEDDQAIPRELQEKMVADVKRRVGVEMQMERLPAGHSPFLSMPDRTAELLINLST
ncbi:alpha/beta-hydrolase [Aspergillus avenaceus]|uniref:Alpha/beta-hydrolase n=1 Tax=Aspergillus avenaceus TaxID=36643 RepID=A0A5N6U745_ASPAV|nr:alpha/beta-hydrolase [Aspergillus avenaceus]